MRLFLASTLAQGRKVFRDTFDRADVSGDIGRASDGSTWQNIRGTWKIFNNSVKATTSDYPIISQTMSVPNNQVELYGTSQGSAAALWITDSGNWWAIGLVQEPTDCNCTYYYNTNYSYATGTCTGQNAGTYNGVNCATYSSGSTCNAYTTNCDNGVYNRGPCANYAYSNLNGLYCIAWNQGNCQGNTYTVCNSSTPYTNCSSYSPSTKNTGTYYYYSCTVVQSSTEGPYASCETCYPQYVRLIQSAANTVSTIAQWSISALASALKVKTSGSQITVSAYSDSNMVSQIGSDLIYTPTGVAITSIFGLTVIPSGYNQGYTTDEIKIKRS
jgi:hypothetical protein